MAYPFSALIYKVGINPVVDVPLSVSRAMKKTGYIPVKGRINTGKFVANLVPFGGGKYRLFVNGVMMKASDVKTGDRVKVVLDVDNKPRITPMPRAFATALKKNRAAAEAFKKLTASRRKEILRYIGNLKNPESVERNVKKAIAALSRTWKGKPVPWIRSV